MRRTRTVLVPLVLAVSLAPGGGGARAQEATDKSGERSFVTAGRGVLVGTQLKIDPENLRNHLPKGYEPALDPAGKATLQIEFFRIHPFEVDGGSGPPRIGSVITAHIVPRDGSDGAWGYDVWHAQSRNDFHSAFTRLGGFAGHVKNASFQRRTLGAVEKIDVSIPWDHSPYSYSIAVGAPPPAGLPQFPDGYHYQLGRHGFIQIRYPLWDIQANAGVGTLTAAPGSPLAEIVGATSVTFPGVILELSFEGYHEVVG